MEKVQRWELHLLESFQSVSGILNVENYFKKIMSILIEIWIGKFLEFSCIHKLK